MEHLKHILSQANETVKALINESTDVDLVVAYGGLARGTANQFSDIDLLAISDSVSVSWSFVLNGRPVSVWSMTWNELSNLSKGLHGVWSVGTSVFMQHHILYSKSEELENRFQEMSSSVPEGSQEVLRKSVTRFTCLYGELWRLEDAVEHDDLLTSAFLIWNIATGIVRILSALNKQPLTTNWGRQIPELAKFKIAPSDFINRYTTLVTSTPVNAVAVARKLVIDVDQLLRLWYNKQQLLPDDIHTELAGETPGIVDSLNKVLSAAASHDLVATRYAAVEFAEFAIWFLRCIEGESSDPRRFGKILDSIESLPNTGPHSLHTLLTSMEISPIVESAKEMASLLQKEAMNSGLNLAEVATIAEAKNFLTIKKTAQL